MSLSLVTAIFTGIILTILTFFVARRLFSGPVQSQTAPEPVIPQPELSATSREYLVELAEQVEQLTIRARANEQRIEAVEEGLAARIAAVNTRLVRARQQWEGAQAEAEAETEEEQVERARNQLLLGHNGAQATDLLGEAYQPPVARPPAGVGSTLSRVGRR